jgi:hypothetical protein
MTLGQGGRRYPNGFRQADAPGLLAAPGGELALELTKVGGRKVGIGHDRLCGSNLPQSLLPPAKPRHAALPKQHEITEGEELTKKEKLKTKWAALEALVGDPKRIALVAADLVAHFEKRVEAMDGKAMIVCMSRRICVDLYNALIKLRPEWEAETLKVVMTGSAEDGPEWQKHIGNKKQRRDLANQFKDAKNPFKIVIVRDMWLTGFDAPCLHTMYADKPMQGHGRGMTK